MANVYVNRAWMLTATTGTGTMTMTTAKASYMTFAEAGVANGDTVDYVIVDGSNFEIGVGTYTSAGTTLSRDTVEVSKISGTVGTTKLTLSGSAEVFLAPATNDIAFSDKINTFNATSQRFGIGTGAIELFVDGAQGSQRRIHFQTGGLSRWAWAVSLTSETGSNAGSNLLLVSYDDAGAVLGTSVISVNRATGTVTIPSLETNVSGVLFDDGSGGVRAATAGTEYMHPGTTSLITVGFTVTPYSIGTPGAASTVTLAAANGNYQYLTNNAAFTLAAPAADCAIDVYVLNGASAGAITFSGFTAGTSIGSPLTTTNTNKFIISVRRINSISTYSIYALQ